MLIKCPSNRRSYVVYTWDTETDPFEYGKEVSPFVSCLFDGYNYYTDWSENCIAAFMKRLENLPEGIIYAHNAGRFDFFWLLPYIDFSEDILIIKNRFVQFKLITGHTCRDSYKILPFPLSAYSKDAMDYQLMKKDVRNKHKKHIVEYLQGDCRYLFELVKSYIETLDASVTVGATAYKKLTKMYPDTDFDMSPEWDGEIRKFYFGGRVERKFIGVRTGQFTVCDINSSYPNAMKRYKHPLGAPKVGYTINDNTFFAQVSGKNYGAFSKIDPETNLVSYDCEHGTFNVTIHELVTAMEHDLFKLETVHFTYDFDESISFGDFVDRFYGLRNVAKECGDKIKYLLYKYLLNNAYGRFSINPENYRDWKLLPMGAPIEMVLNDGSDEDNRRWRMEMLIGEVGYVLYSRPTTEVETKNVAIGASITGASRAVLLDGIARVGEYYYCDTDSIICREPSALELHDSDLGAWKIEAVGDRLALAGKKMYALFDSVREGQPCRKGCIHFDKSPKNSCDGALKSATKGVKLQPSDIVKVALGEKVTYFQDAPVFAFAGTKFIHREIVAR